MAKRTIDINYYHLKDLYVRRKISVERIADMYNVSKSYIYKNLNRYGLTKGNDAVCTTKDEHCASCVYRGKLSFTDGVICNYTSVEGKLRNCSPRHCLYYQKGEQRRGAVEDA